MQEHEGKDGVIHQANTRLLCEVPSLRGELMIDFAPVFLSPYAFTSPFIVESPRLKEIIRDIIMLCDESRNLFQHIYDVLRSQATELLVFMINDKDRLQTDTFQTACLWGML